MKDIELEVYNLKNQIESLKFRINQLQQMRRRAHQLDKLQYNREINRVHQELLIYERRLHEKQDEMDS